MKNEMPENKINLGLIPAFQSLSEKDLVQSNIDNRFCLQLFTDAENPILKISGPAAFSSNDLIGHLAPMGLNALEEQHLSFQKNSDKTTFVSLVSLKKNLKESLKKNLDQLENAFNQVISGAAENSAMHALMLAQGIDWEQCRLLKAYSAYLAQIYPFLSECNAANIFLCHPDITQDFLGLFHSMFNPEDKTIRTNTLDHQTSVFLQVVQKKIQKILQETDKMFLSKIFSLLAATKRTNFYQKKTQQPKTYLSIKIMPGDLPDLPPPQPMFEIFVYASYMEGVHMRGSLVARGGLRFSDRTDYRNEVLALMRTQNLKNATIVPRGAKGGFIEKTLPPSKTKSSEQINPDPYKAFIQGLLDLTDNFLDGTVVPPLNTRCLDGPDTYLVVAADKGTAHRSDDANAIAQEYNFWLQDAFASGGSEGYDHKKMAITAKGAWVSVQHHADQHNISLQQPFTVAGIGDMSGDVFGNGMLLSKHIKLVAAFDHRHIFIDPDPDPEKSHTERLRLFQKPGSSWADYNPKLLSQGGGVFSRDSELITLSPEAQCALGLRNSQNSTQDLITGILKAPVTLFWFGGIGTFIKSESEEHDLVKDRLNDRFRINASDVRAKIIGEGANLGITERARIDLGQQGVHLNSDAIDNAAGVICSDYEVNIKILLKAALDKGFILENARSELLKAIQPEVEHLVLQTTLKQNLAISMFFESQKSSISNNHNLIESCALASEATQQACIRMHERHLEKPLSQLTRPEIATLFAYGKLSAHSILINSPLADSSLLDSWCFDYFPESLRPKLQEPMSSHPLKKEIVCTQLTRDILENLGPNFLEETSYVHNTSALEIIQALILGTLFSNPTKKPSETLCDSFRKLVQGTPSGIQSAINCCLPLRKKEGAFQKTFDSLIEPAHDLWSLLSETFSPHSQASSYFFLYCALLLPFWGKNKSKLRETQTIAEKLSVLLLSQEILDSSDNISLKTAQERKVFSSVCGKVIGLLQTALRFCTQKNTLPEDLLRNDWKEEKSFLEMTSLAKNLSNSPTNSLANFILIGACCDQLTHYLSQNFSSKSTEKPGYLLCP